MTIDDRLKVLGLRVVDVGESACEGCKNQAQLRYDATCYQTCETFKAAVMEEEADVKPGPVDLRTDPARSCDNTGCEHDNEYVCYTSATEMAACKHRVAPVPVGICLNHGCASQHADHCFDDGSHFDPRRCTSRVDTKPAPTIETRLMDAGAKRVENRVAVYDGDCHDDESIQMLLYFLSPDRAVAALRAATGKADGTFIPQWLHDEKLAIKEAQLAARDAELKATTKLISELRGVVAGQRDRLARICDSVARPDGGTKAAADTAIRHADEWLGKAAS